MSSSIPVIHNPISTAPAESSTGHADLTFSVAADYTATEADAARTITIAALSRTATGSANYDSFALAAEARYGFGTPGEGWAIGPLVSLAYVSDDFDGVSESGANALNLFGGGAGHQRTRYGGGLFAGWQGKSGAVDLSAQYVAGSSEFAEVSLTLDGAPGITRPVRSPATDGEGALLTASGHLDLGAGWTFSAETRALLGSESNEVAGSVSLGWRF